MKEKDRIKKLESSEVFEAETEGVKFQGEDGGELGDVVRFVFIPNKEFLELHVDEQNRVIVDTLRGQLLEYCKKIGWYPDDNKESYRIEKQDDGSYVLISYLKRGITPGAKFAHEIEAAQGVIGINQK